MTEGERASPTAHHHLAVVPPGLEAVLARELDALGLGPAHRSPGHVAFEADDAGLCRALLWLRTASRVLRVLDRTRIVRTFPELCRTLERIGWDRVLPAGAPIVLNVAASKSQLYHERAIAQRIMAVLGPRGDADGPPQSLHVHLERDRLTLSLDATGEHAHRRGYRLATAKAPIRENLAAGILLSLDWEGAALVDPMCGSGTFPIEAALMAERVPPGAERTFSAEAWTSLGPLMQLARAAALRERRAPGPIEGSDRVAGAVGAATENAARAGVHVTFLQRDVRELGPDTDEGTLIANLPYGRRVDNDSAAIGAWLDLLERRPRWRGVALTPRRELPGHRAHLRLSNGGIPIWVHVRG